MQRSNQLRCRHGVTAVLAMLYLVLFSSLALGFYAASSLSVQIVANDKRANLALIAAESGMDFMRYQLANVTIPHGTTEAQLFPTLYNALCNNFDGTAVASISKQDNLITIPATGDVALDNTGSSRFRCTIENLGQKILVKVVGRYGAARSGLATRTIRMEYGLARNASKVFDYGVASNGKVTTDGASRIRGATDPKKGSILSATMTDLIPVEALGKEISGDVSITNPNGTVRLGSGVSVGGTSSTTEINKEHIHKGVPAPEFPTVDVTAFKQYATNTYTGGSTLVNARIPANTNPTFTGGAVLKGVIFIETPNVVTFRGNADLQGVIVVQNSPTGTLTSNILDFRGNVSVTGVETLPESFGDLRKLTGSVILAPNFHVRFSGSFGSINGHAIASKFTFDGNASGMIKGSIINLNDTPMLVKGSSEIIIASTGTSNYPAGVFFSSHYAPLPDTYSEVQQ